VVTDSYSPRQVETKYHHETLRKRRERGRGWGERERGREERERTSQSGVNLQDNR